MQLIDFPLSESYPHAAINRHPLTVTPETPLNDAIALMNQVMGSCTLPKARQLSGDQGLKEARSSCILVTKGSQLRGVITQRDLVRLVAKGKNLQNLTVDDVMTKELITLKQSELQDVFTVLKLFRQYRIRHLPIVDNSHNVVGIITPESLRQVLKPIDALRWRRVKEVMVTRVINTVSNSSILDAAQLMVEHRVSCVIIVEQKEERSEFNSYGDYPEPLALIPVGIMTERDIIQFQALDLDLENLTVAQVMSTPLFCLHPEASLWVAHQQMLSSRVSRSVITGDRGELRGILTQTNLLQAIDPMEMSQCIDTLQVEVSQLEREKLALLESRNMLLEKEVQERTIQMQNELAVRQQVEFALHQSETKLNTILNNANVAIASFRVFHNGDWEYDYFSSGCEAMLGYRATELVMNKKLWRSRIFREDREKVIEPMFAEIFTEGTKTIEYRFRHKDGRMLWLSNTLTSKKHSTGKYWEVTSVETDISARKKAEEALQKSEEQWRCLVENSPSIIITINRDGIIQFANRVVSGLEIADVIGKSIYEFIVPEHQQKQRLCLDHVFHTGESVSYDISGIGNNGFLCHYKTQIAPIRQEEKIVAAILVATDISDVFLAKDALRQSEERYRRIVETAAEGIWEINENCQTTFVNQRMAEMLGYTVEEMMNKPFWAFMDEDGQSLCYCLFKNGQPGVKGIQDFKFKRKDGKDLWTLISTQHLYDQNGNYTGALRMVSDITQRKQAELLLLESERLYSALTEAAPVGIFRTNTHGYCSYVNERCYQITGLNSLEALGYGWMRSLHPNDRDRVLAEWQNAVKEETSFRSEYRFVRPDGSLCWVFCQVVPEQDEQGNISSYIGTVTDISDRKSLEISLQKSEAKLYDILNHVNALISSFRVYQDGSFTYDYYSLSHETLIGYTAEELKQNQHLLMSLIPSEDLEWVIKPAWEKIFTETIINCEYRVYHKNGDIHWFSATWTPRHASIGNYWIVTAIATDITARKHAEEALRSSEKRLSLALQAAKAGIWEWKPTKPQNFWSEETFHLLGYQRETCEPSYDNWLLAIHPEDREKADISVKQVWKEKRELNLEYRVLLPDKTVRWLSHIGQIIYDNQCHPQGMIGIQMDITERKENQEFMAFQASLLSQVRHSVIATDLQHRIIYWNPYAEQMYQWKAEEVIGKTLFDVIISEEFSSEYYALLTNLIHVGHWEGELTACRKDNSFLPIHMVKVSLSDTHGHAIGYVGVSLDITERRQAELALQESEVRNRKMLDAFPDLVFRTKADGTFIDFKAPHEDELFMPAQVFIGKTISEVMPFDLTQKAMFYLSQALRNGETQIFEYSLHHREKIRDYEARLVVMGEDEVLWLIRDICDRKQAEKAQQRLQEELEIRVKERTQELEWQKLALDRATIVGITDAKGIITYASAKFCEISQYSREELIGKSHRIINSGYHSPQFFQNLWLTITKGDVWQGEVRNQAKDGSFYWVDTTIVPFIDETGKPFQYLSIRIDITQRKQGEDALRESEQRFRMLADTAPVLIWMSDIDKSFSFFNETWLNFTGRSFEEEINNGWLEGIHPDDVAQFFETYFTAFEARQAFSLEYRLRRFDREYRWIVDTGVPRFTANNEFVGYLGSCMDITERKEGEITLQQQIERERVTVAIAQRIRESLELEEILNTTVAEVQQLLATDRTLVLRFLPDDTSRVIAEAVAPGWPSILHGIFSTLPNKIHSRYLRGGTYAICDREKQKILFSLVDLMVELEVQAKLVVPIIQKDTLWGLLIAHQCSQKREWHPWEIDLLEQLGTQLGIAIQQSELYKQLQIELNERKQAEDNLKKSLREKEILLKEVHHRVKNNLHVVSSLLQLQSETIADAQIAKMFEESENRIHSMALIHEKLYRSQNLAQINFGEYLEDLVTNLFESYNVSNERIQLELETEPIFVNIETATPCGLIVNELVSNSLKHAFPNEKTGKIQVCCYQNEEKRIYLKIKDNGIGFPQNRDFRNTNSMGFQVVCTLIRQLKGSIQIDRTEGTTFDLNFTELHYRKRV